MEQFNKYRDNLEIYLNKKNAFTDVLAVAEDKVKISRVNLCLGMIFAVAMYLIFGYGGDFLANFIGFIYPAYCSIKAIETTEKDDDTKWLTYWVVYAAFSLVESVTDVFLYWIPLYAFMKCVFLVYLMVPTKWNGSIYLYYTFIRPCVLKHQTKIDEYITKGGDVAKNVVTKVTEEGEQILHERLVSGLKDE